MTLTATQIMQNEQVEGWQKAIKEIEDSIDAIIGLMDTESTKFEPLANASLSLNDVRKMLEGAMNI